MQALAVILALAVLAGCDARAVHPTTENLEVGINKLYEKLLAISQQTSAMVQNIQTSQFRTELDAAIADIMAEVAKYNDALTEIGHHTVPASSGMMDQLYDVLRRICRDMQDAKEQITLYGTEAKSMVDQNTGNIQEHMDVYLRKLKKRLHADREEIRNTVATYLSEVQSRVSQNMETAREHVEPYLSGIDSPRMSELSSALRLQAEGLSQQLEIQAQVLRTQLETAGQEMRTLVEGMMDRLTDELPSIATQVREKLEEIVEKVKETATA